MKDGRSVVDSFEYARKIIEEDKDIDIFECLRDSHSEKYDMIEGSSLSTDLVDTDIDPDHSIVTDTEELVSVIESSPRYKGTQEEQDRIIEEITFFEKESQITFIMKCKELIDRFKEDGVVWGVGRGSSCASYVLYLLEVNDVDPLKFDIPFSELSKETTSEFE